MSVSTISRQAGQPGLPLGRMRRYVRDVNLLNLFSLTETILMKTIHAFSPRNSAASLAGAYRWMTCPSSARAVQVVIIDSESLRSVTPRYLRADVRELTPMREAINHYPAKPGKAAARTQIGSYGVTEPDGRFSRGRRNSR